MEKCAIRISNLFESRSTSWAGCVHMLSTPTESISFSVDANESRQHQWNFFGAYTAEAVRNDCRWECRRRANASHVKLQGNKFQHLLCNFIIWFVRWMRSRYSLCALPFSICPHVIRKWCDAVWILTRSDFQLKRLHFILCCVRKSFHSSCRFVLFSFFSSGREQVKTIHRRYSGLWLLSA